MILNKYGIYLGFWELLYVPAPAITPSPVPTWAHGAGEEQWLENGVNFGCFLNHPSTQCSPKLVAENTSYTSCCRWGMKKAPWLDEFVKYYIQQIEQIFSLQNILRAFTVLMYILHLQQKDRTCMGLTTRPFYMRTSLRTSVLGTSLKTFGSCF